MNGFSPSLLRNFDKFKMLEWCYMVQLLKRMLNFQLVMLYRTHIISLYTLLVILCLPVRGRGWNLQPAEVYVVAPPTPGCSGLVFETPPLLFAHLSPCPMTSTPMESLTSRHSINMVSERNDANLKAKFNSVYPTNISFD